MRLARRYITARSRLYRSQFLQVNSYNKYSLEALAKIYTNCNTMHSFAPFSNLKKFFRRLLNFFMIFDNIFAKFGKF